MVIFYSSIEMFGHSQNNLQPNTSKFTSIPNIPQPQKLYPLAPLPFFSEASQPLSLPKLQSHYFSQVRKKQQQQEQMRQTKELKQKIQDLEQKYAQQRIQHESLIEAYREGEILFAEMESENRKLHKELQKQKSKKINSERPRVSLGANKEKDIPVVKITVPHPKKTSMESENSALYRQLKTSVEQNNNLKKLLESEKQKAQFMMSEINRKVDKLVHERDSYKQQLTQKRQQANHEIVQTLHNKVQELNHDIFSMKKKISDSEKVVQEKEIQIENLRLRVSQLSHKTQASDLGIWQHQQLTAKKLFSFSDVSEKQDVLEKQKQINKLKSELIYKKILIDNYERQKYEYFQEKQVMQKKLTKLQLYENHLELSVKEMNRISEYSKQIIVDFMETIDMLRKQIDLKNKKCESQRIEIDKLYDLLKSKKEQLQQCYSNFSHQSKKSSPSTLNQSRLQYLLRERRDSIPS